jgi:hypothetical protein
MVVSPQENYTIRTTATSRRILVPTFADGRVSSGQRSRTPTAAYLNFLDRSRYFLLSSISSFMITRLSGPCPRNHYSENLVAAGIEPGTFGSAARKSDH